jgi:hypothetical protein
MREQSVLLRVATTPKPRMRDTEVKSQAQAASLVSQVVPDFHVASPLACAGRDAEQSLCNIFCSSISQAGNSNVVGERRAQEPQNPTC